MTLNIYELTSICKNVDTRFSNNLYSQVSIRQVHLGAVDKDSLMPCRAYYICLYTLNCCNVNHVKLLLLMKWLLYFDYYTAYVVILDMTSSTPERFRRSGFGV